MKAQSIFIQFDAFDFDISHLFELRYLIVGRESQLIGFVSGDFVFLFKQISLDILLRHFYISLDSRKELGTKTINENVNNDWIAYRMEKYKCR